MARATKQLTAVKVSALRTQGLHADGDGLYLQITGTGAKSWIFRFKVNGRARDMGLGPLSSVSLAEARQKAAECRRLRLGGSDPIETRRSQQASERLAEARSTSFREAAEQLIASHERGWRNEKHRQQWRNTLATYAYPVLGDVGVGAVDTGLVLKVLEPLWRTKPETASRLRGRMERILDAARARGQREGENPCRWRGHLDTLLPKRSKVQTVQHHRALPYRELPALMVELRSLDGITPRALEFTILTAARTGEVIGSRWSEIDTDQRTWTVPASRMKGGKPHTVPLSSRAISLLLDLKAIQLSEFVFPGAKRNRHLSNMAMLMLLRSIRPRITVHGFRSAFKDWCAEQTNYPNFVSEAALAHVVADKVEAAYRRSDLIERRRKLMEAWCRYCHPYQANVVQLRGGLE